MTTSAKRSALLGVGLVVLIVALLAAIGLWYSAGQRETDAVRNLARAPSGCDTTLDFEAAGDFTIYIETVGRFDGPIAGDCVADGPYEIEGSSVPAVALSLTSPGGDLVELTNSSGDTYSADGFTGQSVRTFRIETPGDHVLRVESPDENESQFAVAVGRAPADGVGMMQLGAALTVLAGLVIGGGLMLASRRSQTTDVSATDSAAWSGDPAGWPTAPPGMPAAPAPSGWQPAVGPPTHPPAGASLAPDSSPPTPAPPAAADGFPAAPASGPPAWAPTPPPSHRDSDGSSGDGQRSPWAPPSDVAQ